MGDVLASLRVDPWPMQALITRTINLAVDMVEGDKAGGGGRLIYDALQEPFAVYNSDEARMFALIRVGISLDGGVTGKHVLQQRPGGRAKYPMELGLFENSKCLLHRISASTGR